MKLTRSDAADIITMYKPDVIICRADTIIPSGEGFLRFLNADGLENIFYDLLE